MERCAEVDLARDDDKIKFLVPVSLGVPFSLMTYPFTQPASVVLTIR